VPKRSLLLFVLLLACDETRGPILSLRVAGETPQGGSSVGGTATTPEEDGGPPPAGAGGVPDVDAGQGGAGTTSTGGSGGDPVVYTCEALPPKPWVAIGNPSKLDPNNVNLYNPPLQAVDDNLGTRWSTGVEQAGGEWLEVDFGHPVTLTRIELDHKADRNDDTANPDFPAELLVRMSETTHDFGAPAITTVPGTEDFTMVNFSPPAVGRYLLLQQGGTKTRWWSIHELSAFCDIPAPAP
jgi:hypothetical protein